MHDGVFYNSWIRGVNPWYVRINKAGVRFERRAKRDCGSVRSAPSKRGNIIILSKPLKTGDNNGFSTA